MNPDPADLIGRSIQEVMAELDNLQLYYRIVKVDGKGGPLRYDCIFARYNFEIEHFKISKVWMG